MEHNPIIYRLVKRNLNYQVVEWNIKITHINDDEHMLTIYFGKYNDVNLITNTIYRDTLSNVNGIANSIMNRKLKLGYKWLVDYPNPDKDLPKYNTDANNLVKPMKCQKFTEKHFIPGMLGQGKVNGVRAIVMYDEDPTVTDLFTPVSHIRILSKEGLRYNIKHIEDIFEKYIFNNLENRDLVFDGEIYIPNEFMTSIGGAARNPKNPLHKDLCYIMFDLAIPDIKQEDRLDILFRLDGLLSFKPIDKDFKDHCLYYLHVDKNLSEIDKGKIYILGNDPIYNIDRAIPFMEQMINNGFEGAVFRDPNVEYKFGSRPKSMLKAKRFMDSEFKIINIDLSRDESTNVGVALIYTLKNDLNDQTFMCSGIGTVEEKENIFANRSNHVGKLATVKFYERSKYELPVHANVIAIRDYE